MIVGFAAATNRLGVGMFRSDMPMMPTLTPTLEHLAGFAERHGCGSRRHDRVVRALTDRACGPGKLRPKLDRSTGSASDGHLPPT